MSHHAKAQVSHAEAALGAGRAYEKSNEGRNEMFNNIKELEQEHSRQAAHGSSMKESRGKRIDKELANEDKKLIEKMNEAHERREESRRRNSNKEL
jgi:hypothetical protein